MYRTLKSVGLLVALLGSTSTVSYAQTAEIPTIPSEGVVQRLENNVVPPALKYLMDNGVKLTYLGDAGGLMGYLGESPSGTVQTFYLAPDGNHIIAGVLFKSGGVNVTGVQMYDMKNRFEAAKKMAEGVSEELSQMSPQSSIEPKITSGLTEVTPTQIQNGEAAIVTKDKYLSDKNLDDFKVDIDKVAWFSVGASDAPVLYMLADPNCPFCHNAWKELRPMIMAREISVRVILVAGLEGSEPEAISILSRDEPGRAWFAGEGSTDSMPVAPPPSSSSSKYQEAVKYLKTNTEFMDRYELDATPYFFTFDADGVLYESRGWPREKDVFFSILRGQ